MLVWGGGGGWTIAAFDSRMRMLRLDFLSFWAARIFSVV